MDKQRGSAPNFQVTDELCSSRANFRRLAGQVAARQTARFLLKTVLQVQRGDHRVQRAADGCELHVLHMLFISVLLAG